MQLKSIRWKNFLSYGNSWTTIDLDQNKIIGISGSNGSGKSVLIDAIFFACTGKLFRTKVKKSQIPNSRNKKKCIVELTTQKNNDVYVIRRGIKPDIFEIIKNGKPIEEDASVHDFQTVFEQIFRFNLKVLKNTMIMSSMDYKPFLRFTAQEKRDYIEDILNLHIFSDMLDNLKIDLSILKKDRNEIEIKLQLIEKEINTINKMNLKIKEEQNSNKKEIEGDIDKINKKIDDINKLLDKKKYIYDSNIDEYNKKDEKYNSGFSKNNEKKNKLNNKISNINSEIIRENQEIDKEESGKVFFDSHSDCSTCKQKINKEHKEQIIIDINNRISSIEKKKRKLKKEKDEIHIKITSLAVIEKKVKIFGEKNEEFYNNEIAPLKEEMSTNKSKLFSNKNIIKTFNSALEKLKFKKSTKDTTKKEKLKKNIEKSIYVKNEKEKVLNLSKKLLSDKGIKLYIINKYIPLLNKYVNQFLDIMGASYRLKFDSELQETIVLRGYENLSYHSFSSGEKQRCDLALLFAFLKLAKVKNSFDCNLIILDEILDASMDKSGMMGVISILQSFKLKEKKSIFIISHRQDTENMLDLTYNATKKIFSQIIK